MFSLKHTQFMTYLLPVLKSCVYCTERQKHVEKLWTKGSDPAEHEEELIEFE
jgi:hypothetical protein